MRANQFAHLLLFHAFRMLGGHDDGCNADRPETFVTHRQLALRIRSNPRHFPGVSGIGHTFQDLMAKLNRRRHEFGRFSARIAEHKPLISRTFILIARGIDTLRNIHRLRVHIAMDFHLLPVEAVLLVSDLANTFAPILSVSCVMLSGPRTSPGTTRLLLSASRPHGRSPLQDKHLQLRQKFGHKFYPDALQIRTAGKQIIALAHASSFGSLISRQMLPST